MGFVGYKEALVNLVFMSRKKKIPSERKKWVCNPPLFDKETAAQQPL
jgi:hypothetical protein